MVIFMFRFRLRQGTFPIARSRSSLSSKIESCVSSRAEPEPPVCLTSLPHYAPGGIGKGPSVTHSASAHCRFVDGSQRQVPCLAQPPHGIRAGTRSHRHTHGVSPEGPSPPVFSSRPFILQPAAWHRSLRDTCRSPCPTTTLRVPVSGVLGTSWQDSWLLDGRKHRRVCSACHTRHPQQGVAPAYF